MSMQPIADFFDQEACCSLGKAPAMSAVGQFLLDALAPDGIHGRSVLDIGCGTGLLSLACLELGASRVTGIDLSPASIKVAQDRAQGAGFGDRAVFRVADAAGENLPAHEVVILNQVICCYPDPASLLGAALPATQQVLAFSVPTSSGLRGRAARIAIGAENLWRVARREPFRAYVHDVGNIESRLGDAGLVSTQRLHSSIWYVGVHQQPPSPPAGNLAEEGAIINGHA